MAVPRINRPFLQSVIDLSYITTINVTKSKSGWIKIQGMYEYVHHNLLLVLLIVHTGGKCEKGQ